MIHDATERCGGGCSCSWKIARAVLWLCGWGVGLTQPITSCQLKDSNSPFRPELGRQSRRGPVLFPKAGAVRSGPFSAGQGYSLNKFRQATNHLCAKFIHCAIIRFIVYMKGSACTALSGQTPHGSSSLGYGIAGMSSADVAQHRASEYNT